MSINIVVTTRDEILKTKKRYRFLVTGRSFIIWARVEELLTFSTAQDYLNDWLPILFSQQLNVLLIVESRIKMATLHKTKVAKRHASWKWQSFSELETVKLLKDFSGTHTQTHHAHSHTPIHTIDTHTHTHKTALRAAAAAWKRNQNTDWKWKLLKSEAGSWDMLGRTHSLLIELVRSDRKRLKKRLLGPVVRKGGREGGSKRERGEEDQEKE